MTVRRRIEHVHGASRHKIRDARARGAARTQAGIHRPRAFSHRRTCFCPTGTGTSPSARAHPLAGCAGTAGGSDLSAHAAARASFAAAATTISAARSAVRAVTRASRCRRCTARRRARCRRRAGAAACMVSAGRSRGANAGRILVGRRRFPAAAAERQEQRESQRARALHDTDLCAYRSDARPKQADKPENLSRLHVVQEERAPSGPQCMPELSSAPPVRPGLNWLPRCRQPFSGAAFLWQRSNARYARQRGIGKRRSAYSEGRRLLRGLGLT